MACEICSGTEVKIASPGYVCFVKIEDGLLMAHDGISYVDESGELCVGKGDVFIEIPIAHCPWCGEELGGDAQRQGIHHPIPCLIGDGEQRQQGLCHGFGFRAWTHGAAVTVGGFTAGQESYPVAIVEFPNGQLKEIPLHEVQLKRERHDG